MITLTDSEDLVDFGPIPPEINRLLQQGVDIHPSDPARARAFFRTAIELAPDVLPSYRCLFKLQNKLRDFESARETATSALFRARTQAGLGADWRRWTLAQLTAAPEYPARFVLMFLKALAFIELRDGHEDLATAYLAQLEQLDPEDGVGASVIAALLAHREA